MSVEAISEEDFFDQPGALRLQYEWAAVVRPGAAGIAGPLPPGDEPLAASADRVFSQPALLSFLETLRFWARARLGHEHAATPVLQAYSGRAISPPAAPPAAGPGAWRYVFGLTPPPLPPPELTLAAPPRRFVSLARAAVLAVHFNQIHAFPAAVTYLPLGGRPSAGWLDRAVLLEGLLW